MLRNSSTSIGGRIDFGRPKLVAGLVLIPKYSNGDYLGQCNNRGSFHVSQSRK